MVVTRGREHNFLGIHIQYTEHGTVKIQMKNYLLEAIDESELDVSRNPTTPARKDLFDVNTDSPDLCKREAETFHSVVAKLHTITSCFCVHKGPKKHKAGPKQVEMALGVCKDFTGIRLHIGS